MAQIYRGDALSLGLSERIVLRCGIRAPLAPGMLLVAASLALFARVPIKGTTYAVDVLPGTILPGLRMSISLRSAKTRCRDAV